jgi:hypothetical protein
VFFELEPSAYARAQSLFTRFDYSLSIKAVLAGNNPGRIFVDNIHHPKAALAMTMEGYLLSGNPDDPQIVARLHQFFAEKIFTGEIYLDADWCITLAVSPDSWETKLTELIPTHEIEKLNRYHFLCNELKYDWRANLPKGYSIHSITKEVLTGDRFGITDEFADWLEIELAWGSVDNFINNGIGMIAVHQGSIVSLCRADCFTGNQVDLGIVTASAHRQRGLAAVAAAATVEEAFKRGYEVIGWHCNDTNIGSWKTAEKVGFELNREYTYYFYIYDEIDHLAELGWYYYQRGDHEKTRQYYEQVFENRKENPNYYYHLAAVVWGEVGDADKALAYLNAAADRGWSAQEYTKNNASFRCLHATQEWTEILEKIRQNSA